MNYEWIDNLSKKTDPKNRKNSKNRSEIIACEKTLARKRIFQAPFSNYFEIRAKKFPAAKALAFSLHFLLRREQIHYNFTSNIIKMCEQIFKKKTAPQYSSNSLNCKKPREAQ